MNLDIHAALKRKLASLRRLLRSCQTCLCRAYDFPHRRGGGRCEKYLEVERRFCGKSALENQISEVREAINATRPRRTKSHA